MNVNLLILFFCQALLNSGNALLVATAALSGRALSPDPGLATLPIGVTLFAGMLASFPAAYFMKRFGRRLGFMLGSFFGAAGSLLLSEAVVNGSFLRFVIGSAVVGLSGGFGTYYRFAALEAVVPEKKSMAISFVLAGGVIAAFVGPNLANESRHWFAGAPFAGSYLALSSLFVLAIVSLIPLKLPAPPVDVREEKSRPILQIVRQPEWMAAVVIGCLGFAVMSLIMTATPLSMHAHHHDFSATAFVIEWHMVGMFLPSFFTGHLIRILGLKTVLFAGVILEAGCIVFNQFGTGLVHYTTALILLGVGWNFLFVGATDLLTRTYRPSEKAKVQALNDFLILSVVALSAIFSGKLESLLGYKMLNIASLPALGVVLVFIVVLMVSGRKKAV